MIDGLLSGQRADGGFGVHPYSKWKGAHWRLVSLVELGIPRTNQAARAAASSVLDWIAAPREPLIIKGRERRHASMEGNALAVCCRLGMARNKRVRRLVDVLLRSQWPDGGWNCDPNPDAWRSSFHESLAPIWSLIEYFRETGDANAKDAARRACELLLDHHVFKSRHTGEAIHPEWLHIHWPHYWHYDFFNSLRMIARAGLLDDPRADDAKALLISRRRKDGSWRVDGHCYWRQETEAVFWGDAHQIVTPNAVAVLQ
ncbi:MAG TPA: prenyltransferase/squalene oxidase repeat-containing protein [Candidatus Dormibacteraeota bacterium]|nr:prenyltransferase/squalene oxidase repeat-containing protein [Candidatus Dormibacteraeota bacterium]